MNKFSILKNSLLLISIILGFCSCDKDYNEIGADLIGSQNFSFESKEFSVATYSQSDSKVQSNNLPINQLGVYEDAFFGKTTASFATQLTMEGTYPNTPSGTVVVDKVELIVPYFSNLISKVETQTDTITKYSLNFNFPENTNADFVSEKINLSVYQTNKFLNSYNPIFGYLLPYRYFSDELNSFTIVGPKLNDNAAVAENSAFQFSALEQSETTILDQKYSTTTKISPSIKLNLNKTYFQNVIFNGIAAGKLVDDIVFKEYFRSLLFKVEGVAGQKALSLINFAGGKITVFYTETNAGIGVKKSIVLKMIGNSVNLFENDYGTAIAGLPTSTSPVIATEKLFVKGGAGFHSFIDLFGGTEANGIVAENTPELIALKQSKWIINEASLTFTVDNTFTGVNPYRLYLYDAKNNKTLLDFNFDLEASSTNPKANKPTFGGILYKDANTGESKYKIRITEHIKSIINVDTIRNVRLGLVVTQDINNLTKKYNTNLLDTPYNLKVPEASVINPLGTILWGSNPSGSNNSKKVKFEIFYTKPN